MLRKSFALVGSIVLLSSAALVAQAQSASLSGSYTGTLNLDPLTSLVTIAGTGTTTPFDFTTLFGTYSLLPGGTTTDGQGLLSDGLGNSLNSTFDADEEFTDPLHGTISQTFTITGGTGLFTGVTGYAVGSGTFTVTGLTTATFTETLQSVPEPGSIAFLVGVGMTGAGLLARRRFLRK